MCRLGLNRKCLFRKEIVCFNKEKKMQSTLNEYYNLKKIMKKGNTCVGTILYFEAEFQIVWLNSE